MIVLVIFLLTIGGAVLYFKNFPLEKLPAEELQAVSKKEVAINNSSSTKETETVFQEPNITKGDSGDSTPLDWLTYKDPQFGWQIQYPKDMEIRQRPSTDVTLAIAVNHSGTSIVDVVDKQTKKQFIVISIPGFSFSSPEKMAEEFHKQLLVSTLAKTNQKQEIMALNGLTAIKYQPPQSNYAVRYIFGQWADSATTVYNISLRNESDATSTRILSTFKFVK